MISAIKFPQSFQALLLTGTVLTWVLGFTAFLPALALAEPEDKSKAYMLGLAYKGETWKTAGGGQKSGTRYLDNLDLTLEIDGARAFDKPGLTFYAHAVYNNGHSIGELTGDAQGVSNIETDEAARLYEFWMDKSFGKGGNHSFRFGLYGLDSEFDVTPSAGLFIGSSQGTGAELAQSGLRGPSIFPVTSLGLRYQWQLDERWRLQAAVLDAVPGDPDRPDRTTIRFDKGDGALLVAELSRRSDRLTKAALGVRRYTAEFEPVSAVTSEHAHEKNLGAYGLAEFALIPSGAGPAPKLSGYLRYGVANGEINRFDQYFGGGLVWRNLFSPGFHDELGIGFSHSRNGAGFMESAAREGVNVHSGETNIELTWRLPLTNWFSLQPVMQYIVNPDTNPEHDNALVLGLRFEIALTRSW